MGACTTEKSTMTRINPAYGIIGDKSLIYVLRFTSENPIFVKEFCDQAQTILFDDIGSSGHFRIAPALRADLTERFIFQGLSNDRELQYMPRKNDEIFIAFFVCENSPDIPLSRELEILPIELLEFCKQAQLTFEQVDIRGLYRAA
jgi:hypothetical protein